MQTFSSVLSARETATFSDAKLKGHGADSAATLDPWRASGISLALKYRNAEDSINHGASCLLPNSHANWLAVRTLQLAGRRRSFATTSHALIRYGMPSIDFSNGVFDADVEESKRRGFRHPILDRAHDLRIFVMLTTRMANLAVEPAGTCPDVNDNAQLSFARACPTPYLSFPTRLIDRVCWFALGAGVDRADGYEHHPGCIPERSITPEARRDQSVVHPAEYTFEAATSARPLISFCKRFRRAVEKGIPLAATSPMTYCGRTNQPVGMRSIQRSFQDLAGHRIRIHTDASDRVVYLPKSAQIVARVGQELSAGQIWAHALPVHAQQTPERGDDLVTLCGGKPKLAYLEWLWLRHQVIENPDRLGEALLPASLCTLAVQHVTPVDLYWDLIPCERYVVSEMEAVLLPPLPIKDVRRLRWTLPGDVDMNVGVNAAALRFFTKSHRRPIGSFRRTA